MHLNKVTHTLRETLGNVHLVNSSSLRKFQNNWVRENIREGTCPVWERGFDRARHGRTMVTETSYLLTLIPPATNDEVISVTFFFPPLLFPTHPVTGVNPPTLRLSLSPRGLSFPEGPSPSALLVTHSLNNPLHTLF